MAAPEAETDRPARSASVDLLARLSDDEWLQMLERSIRSPVVDGVRLPGFPPPEIQEQFVGSSDERALREAFEFYRLANRALERHATPLRPTDRVLDFGCGWGRILRFFIKHVDERNLFGIDVMPAAVELCKQHGAPGNVLLIADTPPLPLREGAFKLIYAFSVFSHLPEATATAWIRELASLLAPGGLLVATTRGPWFLRHMEAVGQRPAAELSFTENILRERLDVGQIRPRYERGEHVFIDVGGATEGLSQERYGEAFVPERHVREVWSRWLDPVEFVLEPAGIPQAAIVMRKPRSGVAFSRPGLASRLLARARRRS